MPHYEFPRPALTTDIALFAGSGEDLSLLLIRRRAEPFQGMWALPGGFVDEGERVVEAARRELLEETGIDWEGPLTQVGAYADPGRDPRGWTASIVWGSSLAQELPVFAGDDASDAAWHKVGSLPRLAFDHDQIVAEARARLLGLSD